MTPHGSGYALMDGTERWRCACGEVLTNGAAWRAHSDSMKPLADPPGTCHLVGCPGKGQHAPHGIGSGSWQDYQPREYCLGFPVVGVDISSLDATCSIGGVQAWWVHPDGYVTPKVMAELVDQHKVECSNRKASL